MAEESEKRFHSIMDKLFYAPKPRPNSPSSSGVQISRGKKRPNPGSSLALVEPKLRRDVIEGSQRLSAQAAQAPLCRPWDRGDLMRRLATFKSMTWFGKPKVVSAVNCARRGWVNIDVDVIACEACGARLLFATPSSWAQQQVEKAASVFSIKLDNGHKLLCPWIDNACDEKLAQFPPIAPPVLVDKLRERASALLQLLALPVVSSSATEYKSSPQLEQFLKDSSVLESGNGLAKIYPTECHGNGCETNSANLYYQAQKLISLCGWEPRSLPYVVDCKDEAFLSAKDAISDPTHAFGNGPNASVSMLSARTNELMAENENSKVSSDPKSVVLDCKLCGASIGLWAFSTVPQPIELFRLVGQTEVNPKNNDSGNENYAENGEGVLDPASNGSTSSQNFLNLKFTIAGGPPPTKQNFKATISFPAVGQNLRSRFSSDSYFRGRVYVNQEGTGSARNMILSQEQNVTGNTVSKPAVESEDLDRRHDNGHCSSLSDVQSFGLDHDISENSITFEKGNNINMPLEGINATEHGSLLEAGATGREGIGVKDTVQLPMGNDVIAGSTGKDQNQQWFNKVIEFDPIRQHRHFCPWIASTGSGAPGWKQTLSALQRQKESSHPSPLSDSIFEVDDPIASVRRLFMSPSPK